ncbi:hypothetical protein [Sphingobacterium bambusae]|uniref:Uncharacterized protein n=1 Tax=Sphingobacterium bambusae TaxID=662858 RepID=A0ABW6BK03_9SPHI|nr:hypothetical protein [Sphingobacterium bambusae]WPL49307.1 hypothetical protein SCB77_02405 [Sphingobacterium bambusae]
MKTLYKLLGLAIIDFGLIWLWVYQMDPDPSGSIAIILLVPFVFILNLIIAGIFFLAKKKEYSRVFLINSVIASFVMFYLFGDGIDRYQERRLEGWTFQKADTTFSLIRWKETNEFSMTYSLDPGSSWGFLDGICENEQGKWILKTDSIKMKIDHDNLIGFRNLTDTIKMSKVER